MKKYLLILAFLAATGATHAQLGTPLSQYSGNQLIYNPGYAGTQDLFSANLSIRRLWIGLPGAPNLISLNAHAPFQTERHALGFVYQREEWGPMIGHIVYANYAYKIDLGNSFLSLGLQAGFLNNVIDWDKIDFVTHPNDPGLGKGRTATTSPDINFGAYYHSQNFYLGLSAKHLTMPKFGRIKMDNGEEWYSQKRIQYFMIGGYNFALSEEWDLRPELLVRYINTMPTTVGAGANVVYLNRFFLGAAFHTGQKSLSFTLKGEIMDGFRIGYSYDIHFGKLQSFQRGSHEISINYFMPLWKREEPKAVDSFWL